MGWLLLILAILALVFPPLAIVLLALVIVGVFAKGMDVVADSQRPTASPEWKTRRRHAAEQPHDAVDRHGGEPPAGEVIDVRSYPIPPPTGLPPPMP
jgi:hypothetical protein